MWRCSDRILIMAKKKRKYTRKKDKEFSELVSEPIDSAVPPIIATHYSDGSEDDLSEGQRIAFDAIQKSIDDDHRESDIITPVETKIEKKACAMCEEIDRGLKKCYIVLGGIAFISALLFYSKRSLKPAFIAFISGVLLSLLIWNITLIIKFKELRKKITQ